MSILRPRKPQLKAPSMATLVVLESALSGLRITQPALPAFAYLSRRNASHQAQGRANGAKDGAGKRLGAKKTGGEYVVPGNILFKQRGTLWFPGDNCFMGRDHTIHAGAPGYVRYYRDPARHPKRKFIGIVFEKHQTLPQPANAVRRRKLGMLAYQMPAVDTEEASDQLLDSTATQDISSPSVASPRQHLSTTKIISRPGKASDITLTLRPGYQYRQSNWEIGRAAERKEAEARGRGKSARRLAEFKPRNRFAAWRKSSARIARNMETRSMNRRSGKSKAKK